MRKTISYVFLVLGIFFMMTANCYAAIGYSVNSIDNYLGVCVANVNDWHQVDASTSYQPYEKRYNSKKSPQCVGYVYARLEEKLELSPSFSSGAGAKDIPSNAPNGSVRTSYSTGEKYIIEVYKNDAGSHIVANSWVSFGATSTNKYGHVVYVEEVVGDYVYYTEGGGGYGKVGSGTAGTLKRATKDKFLSKKGGYVGTVVFRPEEQIQAPVQVNSSNSAKNKTLTKKCNHSSFNSYGKCKKCGMEYTVKVSSMSATVYQAVKNDVPVRNRPYAPETITKYLSRGTKVTVVASGKNSAGNLWYKLNDGSWIYSKNLEKVKENEVSPRPIPVPELAPSTLDINLTQSPSTINQGAMFGLRGTVTSNYKITSVNGYIINSSGSTVQSTTDTPNSKSMDIRPANVNQNLLFDKLSPGEYTLKIVATDASGKSRSNLTFFNVKGTESASPVVVTPPAPVTPPPASTSSIRFELEAVPSGNLPYGKAFSLKGWFRSDCPIVEARAYMLDANKNVVMQSDKASSTTSNYKIQGYKLDKAMKFNELSPGAYYLKYYVRDSNGDTAEWISDKFYIVK